MRELKKSSILQIANLSVDQITRFVICQITCSNQSNSPGPTAYLPRANLWLMDRIDADYQIACGSKEKQHILSCISATVFTKSSARKKTTPWNSDQNVGESSPAPSIVSVPKGRQKRFRSFQLYFRVAFQGFCFGCEVIV